ncbi:MAG: hypothetical protein M5U18_08265 [Dehalococcoidia bacterium]|nr:hypothetical protein [Dehalococcoidia bacterium]
MSVGLGMGAAGVGVVEACEFSAGVIDGLFVFARFEGVDAEAVGAGLAVPGTAHFDDGAVFGREEAAGLDRGVFEGVLDHGVDVRLGETDGDGQAGLRVGSGESIVGEPGG